jgi:hypothetical protein
MNHLASMILAQSVRMRPDFSVIPGSNTLQSLINGVGALALLLSLAGIIVGGGLWGVCRPTTTPPPSASAPPCTRSSGRSSSVPAPPS